MCTSFVCVSQIDLYRIALRAWGVGVHVHLIMHPTGSPLLILCHKPMYINVGHMLS